MSTGSKESLSSAAWSDVYQEARQVGAQRLPPAETQACLKRVCYHLYRGATPSEAESRDLFFSLSKILPHNHPANRYLALAALRALID
ncbi:hypothetical protein KIPB_009480, partial [Kipferlia bialata]|eukprot:g9480.t1